MKQENKIRYFYSIIIAVIVNLLFLPFLYIENLIILPGIQAVVNVIVLPIVLVVLNVYWFVKKKIDCFSVLYLVIPVSCLAGGLCSYFNWGIITRHFFSPDEETVMVVTIIITISVGISLILLSMAHAMLKILESHMALGRKFLAWTGIIILAGIAAFIFGVIVYKVF